jgi:hypothetical protein
VLPKGILFGYLYAQNAAEVFHVVPSGVMPPSITIPGEAPIVEIALLRVI